MRALLKDGTWVEIDTKCLFHNQYNTTDESGNKRIFDRDIKRIEGDVRLGKGCCKHCGAIVNRGEEEEHFSLRESRPCEDCFWYMRHEVGNEEKGKVVSQEKNPDGKTVIRTIVTKEVTYERRCTYIEQGKLACANSMCRAYGIDWFTPENTFFLKYPDGFEKKPLRDVLMHSGFFPRNDFVLTFYKDIGSYTLEAWFDQDDPDTLSCFCMRNTRRNIRFRLEDGTFYMEDGFSWVPTKDLTLPSYAFDAVKKILGGICAK